ncbi:hypothetical protein D3C71_1877550 [compost metagenome]
MISPAFQYLINLVFYMINNFITLGQNVGLTLRRHIRPDRPLDCTYQGLHQVSLVDKFKSYILDGFLVVIKHRIKQHCLKINVCLVLCYRLERKFNRAVLNRNSGMNIFNQGNLQA